MADELEVAALDMSLTKAWLQSRDPPRDVPYPGDDWAITFRAQTEDENGVLASVDLTGATIVMRLKKALTDPDSSAVLTRTSGQLIPGSATKLQIQILNQSVADTKGQFTVRFGSETADRDALLGAMGSLLHFDVRVTYGDGSRDTLFAGRLEVPYVVTRVL